MDAEYGSQGCLMEQRQMRMVNLIESWDLALTSSASRCLKGEIQCLLFMFEDCNTKNPNMAKMSLHGEQRVFHYKM